MLIFVMDKGFHFSAAAAPWIWYAVSACRKGRERERERTEISCTKELLKKGGAVSIVHLTDLSPLARSQRVGECAAHRAGCDGIHSGTHHTSLTEATALRKTLRSYAFITR